MTRSKIVWWAPATLAFACNGRIVADSASLGISNGSDGHGGAGAAVSAPGPAIDAQAACASCGAGGKVSDPAPGVCAGSVQTACAVPDGHVVPTKTAEELESRIVSDWLECSSEGGYPSEYGDGIRILADHTWYSLVQNGACGYDPLSTGFDGYGTWTISDEPSFTGQFNLLSVKGGGAGYFPKFSDTGQLLLDPGGLPTRYVLMPAAGQSD